LRQFARSQELIIPFDISCSLCDGWSRAPETPSP